MSANVVLVGLDQKTEADLLCKEMSGVGKGDPPTLIGIEFTVAGQISADGTKTLFRFVRAPGLTDTDRLNWIISHIYLVDDTWQLSVHLDINTDGIRAQIDIEINDP